MFVPVAAATVLVLLILLVRAKLRLPAWQRNIPGPPLSSVLFGSYLFLRENPHLAMERWFDQYGDMIVLRRGLLVSQKLPSIATRDPKAARRVLKSHWKGRAYHQLRIEGEPEMFTADGYTWKRSRRLCTPAFAHADESYPLVTGLVSKMCHLHFDVPSSEGDGCATVEVDSLMCRLALDIIGESIWGADFQALENKESPVLSLSNEMLQIQGARGNPLRKLFRKLLGPPKRLMEIRRYLKEMALRAIQARRQTLLAGTTDHSRCDLLTRLLTVQDDEGKTMSDDQMANEICIFITVGHETTAHSMAWTLYHLAVNASAAERLRSEVDAVMGARRIPELKDFSSMPWLACVVREALRLDPVTPMGSVRSLLRETELCGFNVPAGESVWVPFYPLFRHSKLWERPTEFLPERYGDAPPSWDSFNNTLLPFASGPRACIGQPFALAEMNATIVTLARNYTWSLVPNQIIEREVRVTLKPKNGIQLRFVKR